MIRHTGRARGAEVLRSVLCLAVLLAVISIVGSPGSPAAAPLPAPPLPLDQPATPEADLPLPAPSPGAAHADPTVSQRPLGSQPFVTILCKFADVADEPHSVAYFEEMLAKTGSGLDHYWREVSYGQMDLAGSKVVGWYRLPGTRAAYRAPTALGNDPDRLVKDCTAAADDEVHFPDYAGINLVFNFPLSTLATGGKTCLHLDGQDKCYGLTSLWPGTASEQGTVAHEMGHALGLAHSSSGHEVQYGNPWDVMSGIGACGRDPVYGALAQHMIAYDKDVLSWIPASRKFLAGPQAATTITLERLAQPGPTGYLMAQIPIGGSPTHFYTVEARRRAGHDASLAGDAVIIHEVDTQRPLPAHLISHLGDDDTRLLAGAWTPGMVFRDASHGIAVAVDRETASGFEVTIATGRSAANREPTAFPDGLPDGHIIPGPTAGDGVVPASVAAGRIQDLFVTWLEPGTGAAAPTIQSAGHLAGPEPMEQGWQRTGQANEGPAAERFASSRLAIGAGADGYAAWQNLKATMHGIASVTDVDLWFAHRPASGIWGPSVRINGEATAIRSHLAFAVDRAGGVYAVWDENRGDQQDIRFAYAGTGSAFSTDSAVSAERPGVSRSSPDIAVDGQGNAEAVWLESSASASEIHSAYRPSGGSWQDDGALDSPAGIENASTAVALDGRGNAHAVWETYRTCGEKLVLVDVMYAVRPAGGGWQPAVKIAGDAGSADVSPPDIVVNEAGDIYVVWEEKASEQFELFARRRVAGGQPGSADNAVGWGPRLRIGSAAGTPEPAQPAIAVDGEGRAHVAWLDSRAGLRQIRVTDLP